MNTVERITHLIKEKGITDKKFLEDLGLGKNKLGEWRSGVTESYKKFLPQIADYFEVSTDYLLCQTDDPTPPWKKYALPDAENSTSKIDGLGNRIKLKLRQMEMTQRDLAQKLNVPILTLIDYIAERKKPNANTLDKLAQILSTSTEYLTTGSVIDDPNPAGTQWEEDEPEIVLGFRNALPNDILTIENCYATGNVSASYTAGGLIGISGYSTLINCYATGDVSALSLPY